MAPTVDDAVAARSQPAGLLKEATDTISANQTLTFTPYVRLVLPADGYVFWVKKSLVAPAVLNSFAMNEAPLNGVEYPSADYSFQVQGSVHYSVEIQQEETASLSINRVAFTSEDFVQGFNLVDPNVIYIATFRGIRFAFSGKGMFYEQMKLWHYEGNAVYSTMSTQVVDDPRTFHDRLIVSNSLPNWLSLQYYDPPYPVDVPMPKVPLYPSFLVPQNIQPPYGVVHIGPDDTSVDQAVPSYGPTLTSDQLARDRVRVTLYGLDAATSQDWFDATIGYLRDAGVMGLTNVPNLRDDKVTQRELFVIAMKKRIDFEVSYVQTRVRDQARQVIETVIPPTIEIATINVIPQE